MTGSQHTESVTHARWRAQAAGSQHWVTAHSKRDAHDVQHTVSVTHTRLRAQAAIWAQGGGERRPAAQGSHRALHHASITQSQEHGRLSEQQVSSILRPWIAVPVQPVQPVSVQGPTHRPACAVSTPRSAPLRACRPLLLCPSSRLPALFPSSRLPALCPSFRLPALCSSSRYACWPMLFLYLLSLVGPCSFCP